MDTVKIAHIAVDAKFINSPIELFDSLGNIQNTYYFKNNKKNISEIKYINRLNVRESFTDIINEIIMEKYPVVILHSKCGISTKQILRLPKSIILIWISFGYDIYSNSVLNRLPIKMGLFLPKTRKYLKYNFFKNTLRKIYLFSEQYIYYPQFLKRINYVSTILDNEYQLLQTNKYISAQKFDFSIVGKDFLNNMDLDNPIVDNQKKYILIGNSATLENNHIDIFDYLKDISLEEMKLLVPLNYGENWYKKIVLKEGEKAFSSNFMPLLEFVPVLEYYNLLKKCRAAIMGHQRQQALGNIIVLLLNGAKVFLSENSLLYDFYIKQGVKVFSLENELNTENLMSPLTEEDKKNNIQILKESYSFEHVRKKLYSSICSIIDKIEYF